tara:strand:+ start:4201 stop:4878 length:678 start_codon:yes stop_codon:yes gene_type:complete
MGREFPYTPEGMAAAEDYRSSMGMRGGGMLGFRPVGYQDGDLVDEELNTVEQLRNRFYELRKLISDGASGAEEELIKLIWREEQGLRASKDPTINKIIDNYIGAQDLQPYQGPQEPPDQISTTDPYWGFGYQEEYDPYGQETADTQWVEGSTGRHQGQPYNEPDQISTTDPYWGFGYQEEYDPYGQETADTQWVEGSTGRNQGQPYNRKARGGLMSLARRRGYAG